MGDDALQFPGQRPPFAPGNKLGRRHGALDPDAVRERLPAMEAETVGAIEEYMQDLGYRPPDRMLVEQLAWLRVQWQLVREQLQRETGGVVFQIKGGRTTHVDCWYLVERLLHHFREHAKALGLGPRERAALEVHLAARDSMRRGGDAGGVVQRVRTRYAGEAS